MDQRQEISDQAPTSNKESEQILSDESDEDDAGDMVDVYIERPKEKWDCESILSMKSCATAVLLWWIDVF